MTKADKENQILTWTVIGGIVGVGAIALLLAMRREREAPLSAIGDTIAHIGGILKSNDIDEPGPVRNFENKLRKNENTLGAVVDWIATGIQLWKIFKH